jgi:Putative transposase of IS4/5 family (DUF4096)
MQRPDLDTLACVNAECHSLGRPGQGNLAIRKVYGKDHLRLLRCGTCREEFPMPCSPANASVLYPCDLPDAEWAQLAPLLPAPAQRGRPRAWALRLLVNALFYLLRTGCAWRYLPREYPPWQTTYTTFRQWRLQGVWQQIHEA